MMKEKPKRLKGTVLFTVVSVMMVMVVFLLGTLALAATASNRAYSNYQKEQTEYTSRAVLDSVVQAINDKNNPDIRNAVLGMPGNEMTVTVNDSSDGKDYEVHVEKVSTPHKSYDASKGTWVDGNEFLLSVTVGKTMAQTTYTAKMSAVVEPPKQNNNPGGAFVSIGDMGGNEISVHGFTTGGSYIGVGEAPTTFSFGANGDQTIDGPFYLNGDCDMPTSIYLHFTKAKDFMAITGDLTLTNSGFTTDFSGFQTATQVDGNYENAPYIYVGGTLKAGSSTTNTIGDPDYPLHIYAGVLDAANAAAFKVYGDLYTFNSGTDVVNTIGSQNGYGALYQWTKGTLTRSDDNSDTSLGNWFSRGSIKVDLTNHNSEIQGDLRCEQNITLTGSKQFTVGGDLVCGGTLTIPSGATLQCDGTIYADVLDNKGIVYTLETPKVRKLAEGSNEPTTHDDTQVPPTLITSVKDAYGDIYPKNYTLDNLKQNVLQQPVGSAYEYPDSPDELPSSVWDEKDGYTVPIYDPSNAPTPESDDSYYIVDRNCVLTGTFKKNIYIKADSPIVVVLNNVSFSTEGAYSGNIIVNDDKLVTFFVDGYCALGQGFDPSVMNEPEKLYTSNPDGMYANLGTTLITENIMNAIAGGTVDESKWKYSDNLQGVIGSLKNDLNVYQETTLSDECHFPNVVIYGKENSVMSVGNGGLVTAQVRANRMMFCAQQATDIADGKTITYVTPDTKPGGMQYYKASPATGRHAVGLIGQLIAGSIRVKNSGNWGMLYMTEGGGTTCTCAKKATCGCTGAPGCSCGCSDCACDTESSDPSDGTPTKYSVMYYEYY